MKTKTQPTESGPIGKFPVAKRHQISSKHKRAKIAAIAERIRQRQQAKGAL